MPLFRSRKDSTPPPVQLPNTASPGAGGAGNPRRSNSVVSMTSVDSVKSTSSLNSASNKLKSFFKTTSNDAKEIISIDHELNKLHIAKSRDNSNSPEKDSLLGTPNGGLHKRISTIAETSSTYSNGYEESESDDYSDDEEEEDIHTHPIKVKKLSPDQHHDLTKLLSNMVTWGFKKSSANIKNYKELKDYADLESKQTYSLLDSTNKIHKLLKSLNGASIIGDDQINLIKNLSLKIEKLIKFKKYDLVTNEKSMFERYGVVKQVIGRGAYGLIKIIDPDPNAVSPTSMNFNFDRHLYAVKQWFPRKAEAHDHFIERILLEFVIQSTLNNEHIANTVDLMCGLPINSHNDAVLQFSQVMSCNQGGDLYSYLMNPLDVSNQSISRITLDEVDCWIKQITTGLNYMHNHGVAHCDLKLENILISYERVPASHGDARMILKISDFGKSFVFRTKFDKKEQLLTSADGLIGTLPYIPPEEFLARSSTSSTANTYSSIKKDCWCLGILIVVLFNIRKHYYSGISSSVELDRRFRYITDDDDNDDYCYYGTVFLWESAECKPRGSGSGRATYKDKAFGEFVNKRMIADYDPESKEWLVRRGGSFRPIDEICTLLTLEEKDADCADEEDENQDELNELRTMIIYKLLDVDPVGRLNTDDFLTSDWMDAVDICSIDSGL
ncbi:putative serine/threonine-protein kinase HAL5-like [Candida viswanathii]|uniref:non-specific serine/threonine protein kinase n=1 Tax=Candida viswanathii TaxID=5486 RepID=A0A367YBZ4_9ASCO|nr:putative serine/threonine-protein kinase HAL5-like [Candida viswanathii]